MSDAPDPHAPDGIEAGKRLVRAGGDRGLSLAERMAERLHRLAWRSPVHRFRLRGRYPLKLIAVPDDPFLGDVERGAALLDGVVRFRGQEVPLSAIGFDRAGLPANMAIWLHGFDWLRDLSSVAPRATAVPIAERIMRQWLDAHADKVSDPAWRPSAWGRRILFWTAHAPLILSSTDLVYRSKVLNTLARGARHLERTADKAPIGQPRVAGWCGLVAANLLIPGGDARRGAVEAGLRRAIAASVFDDGGSIGRSPSAQSDILMLLSMLASAYAARRIDPPEFLAETTQRMLSALLGVAHGDGGLSSWQGAGPTDGETMSMLVAGSGARVRPLRQARDWGYQRLVGGKTVLILDAAPPPVARLIEGGCASTLAFEMSDGDHRIVVNCGGARSAHNMVPADLAEGLRTTAAHSTLTLADSNSTAIHPDGTLGKGVQEVELSRQEAEAMSRIEVSHDGYARRFGFLHRRQLVLGNDGRDLRGEDMLLPAGRRRRGGDTGYAIRFHLAPGVEVAPTADGLAAFLRLPGGALWQFRARGAAMETDSSLWIAPDGRPVATRQIVLTGTAPAGGASVSWLFHKAR